MGEQKIYTQVLNNVKRFLLFALLFPLIKIEIIKTYVDMYLNFQNQILYLHKNLVFKL